MKKVVIISPYDKIYPPENGGMQRCFFMLPELAKYFDTTVIMYQSKDSFEVAFEKYPILKKLNIVSILEIYKEPKDIFSYLPGSLKKSLRYRWKRKRFFETASSTYLHIQPILSDILKKNMIDTILIENSADITLCQAIHRISPSTKIIYEAHNVDSDLVYEKYKKGLISHKLYKGILATESTLFKTCDGVVCMSIDDENILKRLNHEKIKTKVNTTTIPIPDKLAISGVLDENCKKILYCGSLNYQPNYEALVWFYNTIWPFLRKKSEVELLIIGSGQPHPSLNQLKSDTRIKMIGRVPNVWDYYNMASVAIVPLLSGSGIRLKILEAMAMGVPVVSTSKGAEGIRYTNDENILIEDNPEIFASKTLNLINDINKRKQISNNARNLMESTYSWNQIGSELKEFIENI